MFPEERRSKAIVLGVKKDSEVVVVDIVGKKIIQISTTKPTRDSVKYKRG